MLFTDSLTVGSNTASLDYTIPGTVLADGTVVFGSAAGDEVGTGTGLVNGMALANRCFSYSDAAMTMRSDIVYRPDDQACDDGKIGNEYVKENGGLVLTGTISTAIPEPSSILLVSVGLSCIFLLYFTFPGERSD